MPKTNVKNEDMSNVSDDAVVYMMYDMIYTRLDLEQAVSVLSKFLASLG